MKKLALESVYCVRSLTPDKEAITKQHKKELDKIEKICYNLPLYCNISDDSVVEVIKKENFINTSKLPTIASNDVHNIERI